MSPTPPPLEIPDDPLLAAFDQLPDSQHLTTKQVAALLQVSPKWLGARRAIGKSPPWVGLGQMHVRYMVGPLRAWLLANQENAPASSFERTQRERDRILGLDEEIIRSGRRRKK